MKVAILGLGNFGTALAQHLALQGSSVTAWAREADILKGVKEKRKNPVALSNIELDERIQTTPDISKACEAEVIVLTISSSASLVYYEQVHALRHSNGR